MTYYLNMSYIIYKICCDDLPEFIYVGSTKSFIKRKNRHKHNCNNGCTQKLYTTIRENGGWDNWRMVIIEECGEITLIQARIKEEENRLKLNANLNMKKCYQTEEEKKQYYEANIEKIKEYYEANNEEIKQQKKEYYKANNEEIKEKTKQYQQANKKKIKEYKNQKFTCECGRTIILGSKSYHLKTNIHKELMEEINNKII
jgi:hypothetical protein